MTAPALGDRLVAFRLKASLYPMKIMQIASLDRVALENQLEQTIAQAPNLFKSACVILDFSAYKETARLDELEVYLQLLKNAGMIPIGCCHVPASLANSIDQIALPVLPMTQGTSSEKPTTTSTATTRKIIYGNVRSGQQIYAKDTDLIVTGSVSQGAEVLADGDIHVYGALKGRALAGASENDDARIFCLKLHAELVAIAGHYMVSDQMPQELNNEAVHIQLREDKLDFLAM